MGPQKTIGVLVRRFLIDELLDDTEEIDGDEDLLADGMIDSLGMVRLVAFLEEELAVTVPPEDFTIENFQTVSRIEDYVARRLEAANG